jgi:hypothetical protein
MDRDEEIRLMIETPERLSAIIKRWLAAPEVRAALHRHDRVKEPSPPSRP